MIAIFIPHRLPQVCLMRTGSFTGKKVNYRCLHTGNDKELKDNWKLADPPQIWTARYAPYNINEVDRVHKNKDLPHPLANPFSRDIYISIPLYKAVVIVTGANATLKLDINYTYPIYTTILIDMSTLDPSFHNEFTHIGGMKFLSCYAEPYITFDFYLMPFQPMLWLCFIMSILFRFSVLYVYTTWKHKQSPFSLWFSFISLLLDDFTSVPHVIGKGLFFRLIFLTWGPIAVLFTNCYSGLMITELNAPLKETRSQTFEDLVCQGGYILKGPTTPDGIARWAKDMPFENYLAYWGNAQDIFNRRKVRNYGNSIASENCYRMLSSAIQIFVGRPVYHWQAILLQQLGYFFLNNLPPFNRTRRMPSHLLKEELIALLLLNPVHNIFPKGIDQQRTNYSISELQALVERNVINCRERSVFIADLNAHQGEMAFLAKNYPSKKFHIGHDTLGINMHSWWFLGGGRSSSSSSVSSVQRNFQSLIQTGIYFRLKMEMANTMWLKRTPVATDEKTSTVTALTMEGGIITIFIISAPLMCLTFIFFVIEREKYQFTMASVLCTFILFIF